MNNAQIFKVGNIITSYHGGYSRIVRIKERWLKYGATRSWETVDETEDPTLRGEIINPIIFSVKIAKPDGTPIKGKAQSSCDAAYCRLASESIPNRIKEMDREKERLFELLKTII